MGAIQRVERRGDTFVLRAERGGAAVLFPADGIFRIKFFWQGEPDLSSTVAIDPAFRQKKRKRDRAGGNRRPGDPSYFPDRA
ncbi:hypothetical protein VQ056_20960 [Paenibacillus sp. JTLBN-2024]